MKVILQTNQSVRAREITIVLNFLLIVDILKYAYDIK
jgi:hypothetical protein